MTVNPDLKFYNVHHQGSADLTAKHRPEIESVQSRMSALAEHSFKSLGLQFKPNDTEIKFTFEGCKICAETSYASLIALAAKTKHVATQLQAQPQDQANEAKAKELMNESYKYFFEYDKDGEIKEVKMYKFDKTTKTLSKTPETISISKAERGLIIKMAEAVPPTAAVELQEVTEPSIELEPAPLNLGPYQGHYKTFIDWVGDGAEGNKPFTGEVKKAIKAIKKIQIIENEDEEKQPKNEILGIIKFLTGGEHLQGRCRGVDMQNLFVPNFCDNLENNNIEKLKGILAEVISKIVEKEPLRTD